MNTEKRKENVGRKFSMWVSFSCDWYSNYQ